MSKKESANDRFDRMKKLDKKASALKRKELNVDVRDRGKVRDSSQLKKHRGKEFKEEYWEEEYEYDYV